MADSHTFSDRQRKPLLKKLNPIWWFGNDFEPEPPQWYLDQGGTKLKWYIRNNLQNCESFCWVYPMLEISLVLGGAVYWFSLSRWYLLALIPLALLFTGGVEDRNYTVRGSAPILNTDAADVGQSGFMWKVIMLMGFLPLPYVSYSGKRVLWHLGWNPFGKFVKKFNILRSKVQVV